MSKFETITACLPDRKEMVAEIFYESALWVEINQEKEVGKFNIEFYNHPENSNWEFSYEEAMEAITKAKERLASMKIVDKEEYDKLMGDED
ncbi:MAG: hypothetical protein H6620_12690 [Halobacteriovoraceae bacterium]|nr:hypothetical protein [Halobacteriovoraceae bacterium]